MKRRHLQNIVLSLITCILLLLSVEPVLRIVDPLGGYTYYADLSRLFAGYVVSERGYSMYPGMYQFTDWNALIERSGNRHTPDSKASACTLAFMGDSVTFGFGVDDSETFVNLIAKQVDAHIINTAIPLYNSRNILHTLNTTAADGYVYVIIGNDDEVTYTRKNVYPIPNVFKQDGIRVYIDALTHLHGEGLKRDTARFNADLGVLRARPNVLLIAFRDPSGWYQRLPGDVVLLPHWTQGNSVIDGHPNAAGHAEIAAALLPYVAGFVEQMCQA